MVSYNIKHALTIQPSNHTPWYLPKTLENLCIHQNLHLMFMAALLTIAKLWKQPRCPSVGKWNKYTVVHLDKGILFSTKKKLAIKP